MPRDPWARLRAADPTPDADLLARFAADRDPDAIELLVWRHGRMVLAVCRRILGDHHLAEDAFQATFLVLARKAGAVRGSAPAWLHRVALRVAGRAAKRVNKSARLAADPPAPAIPAPDFALRAVLDEEIDRLPDRLRRAVVLCYLDGRTTDDAARLLGVPRGTVQSRLSAARERLTARLTRRGVTGPAVGLAVGGEVLTADAVGKCVGEAVRFITQGTAAGQSAVLLAEVVMRATKLKAVSVAAGMVMAVSAGLGTGVGVVLAQKGDGPPAPAKSEAKLPKVEAKPPAPTEPVQETRILSVEEQLKKLDYEIYIRRDELRRISSESAARFFQTHAEELYRQLWRLREDRSRTQIALELFRETLAAYPGIGDLKRLQITARERLAEKLKTAGTEPDDPELAAARQEAELRQTQCSYICKFVRSEVEATLPFPPRAIVRNEDLMNGVPGKLFQLMDEEEARLNSHITMYTQILEERQRILDKLAPAEELRRVLSQELTVRKLQAQGITLPEPARGADPSGVADKLDQILREVAALQAEVRAAAKK